VLTYDGSKWVNTSDTTSVSDRIVSGTTAAVIANQGGGTVSFTLGGTAGAAYLHPTLGLVASGVSATGSIKGWSGYFTGSVTAASYYQSSDERLKTNIKTTGGLAVVDKLRGVTFDWKKDGKPSAGVIAQEVEKVMPSAVGSNDLGMKTVNYDQLVAPLIESVKELHRDNAALEAALREQNDRLSSQIRALRADNDNLRSEVRAMRKEAR
jgi:hypothetical protein